VASNVKSGLLLILDTTSNAVAAPSALKAPSGKMCSEIIPPTRTDNLSKPLMSYGALIEDSKNALAIDVCLPPVVIESFAPHQSQSQQQIQDQHLLSFLHNPHHYQ
jgi:hypothetical protein